MIILVNLTYRDGWSVHTLAEDAKTVIGPWLDVDSEATLLRLLRGCGATEEAMVETQRNMARWGRDSAWIDVTDEGRRLLRLRV